MHLAAAMGRTQHRARLEQIEAVHHTDVQLESFAEVFGTKRRAIGSRSPPSQQRSLSLGLADSRWLDATLPISIESEAHCGPMA